MVKDHVQQFRDGFEYRDITGEIGLIHLAKSPQKRVQCGAPAFIRIAMHSLPDAHRRHRREPIHER
jgi:hypothetical protein